MVKKRIWLVNFYAMPPKYESRLRTIKFAQYLKLNGYEVTIISSSFLHNTNLNLISDEKSYIHAEYNNLNFIHIKTIGYKNNGLKRIYALFEFHLKLFFLKLKFPKPEVIIHTVLPPFGNIIYFVSKYFKAKYIVEVLDLWPESFIDLNVISKKNIITKFLYFSEKWIYKKADNVVFSMEGGAQYIVDKKWDIKNGGPINLNKIKYLNNGVDLADFYSYIENYKINDPDLNDKSTAKIIYIGSIRLANNLMELVSAGEFLMKYPNVKILIYGDGDDREFLIKYCFESEITNVIFKDKWVAPQFVPYILSQSDVNVLNYKSGSFGKYGGSQSKLFQYMASGKPICSNINMMFCPINKFNLGIAREYKNSQEYADSLIHLINLKEPELEDMKLRMNHVVELYDYNYLTKQLIEII